jgi:putative membrane protein
MISGETVTIDAAASRRGFALFAAAALSGLLWSGIGPHDRLTWLLEVIPVIIALPLLTFTRGSFPLTGLAYSLIAFHAAVLMLGGHYTYAEVPLGNWVRDAFGLVRNNYDRLGHFTQGFVPAIIAREILLRSTPPRRLAVLSCRSGLSCDQCLLRIHRMVDRRHRRRQRRGLSGNSG